MSDSAVEAFPSLPRDRRPTTRWGQVCSEWSREADRMIALAASARCAWWTVAAQTNGRCPRRSGAVMRARSSEADDADGDSHESRRQHEHFDRLCQRRAEINENEL